MEIRERAVAPCVEADPEGGWGALARGEGRARQPRGCLWGQGGQAGQAQPPLPPHLLLQPLLGHRWRMWWGWGHALPGGRGGW